MARRVVNRDNRVLRLSRSLMDENGWFYHRVTAMKQVNVDSSKSLMAKLGDATDQPMILGDISFEGSQIFCLLLPESEGKRSAVFELVHGVSTIRSRRLHFSETEIGVDTGNNRIGVLDVGLLVVIGVLDWVIDLQTLTWDQLANGEF